jgi:predicted acylesterase/phospholipase RssA
MGSVVKLDQTRPGTSRTALVLGGGGFTAGVYEIGALRALGLLSVNRTVNDFDVYVGTSAGSLVAAALANGITPEEMMRLVLEQEPTLPRARPTSLLRPNYLEYLLRGVELPWRIAKLTSGLVRGLGRITAVDVVAGFAESLPSGLYSTGGIERYVREVLSTAGRSDDFRALERELFLAATDLDTGERIVFGSEDWEDVPISTAVAASSALPMVYKPVKVKGRELVDGGIMSTTNLDLAVEAGASFVVVVNPLVPYINDFQHRIRTLAGSRVRRVSDLGFPHIGYQTFKMVAHQRLHELARGWEQRYPGVDIILIEPEPNDELMFRTAIMSSASNVDVARHGFRSVALKLVRDYPDFKRVTERHGIEISATRVRDLIDRLDSERDQARAWRKILEQTTSTLLRQSAQQ